MRDLLAVLRDTLPIRDVSREPNRGPWCFVWEGSPTPEQEAQAIAVADAWDAEQTAAMRPALAARCHELAAAHVARWFVGQVPVQLLLWRLDPAHASNATLQDRLAAVQAWMQATQGRGLLLAAKAQAGQITGVSGADFADIGAPPYVFAQLLETLT